MSTAVYVFAPYRLLPEQRQLLRAGVPVKLGGRAFDVLLALIEHRDRTVSKNELMDLVWPTVVVEENNLEVQIVTLRKLLGYAAIATIPGRGYRFTLSVMGEGLLEASDPGAAGAQNTQTVISKSGYLPLPRPGSMLIGRQRDCDAVMNLLISHRLVTLTGAGGIGKTRLAIHAASNQTVVRNVAWADLSTVTDQERVPIAVATALDVSLDDGAESVSSIVSAMRRRPAALLVIDNAEHLIEATAELARVVVSSVETLSILTTSREPLRIDGEVVYTLGGLAVPSEEVLADDCQGFEAISLFLARAKAANNRFQLNSDDTAEIVGLCRTLDGLPLAIELAAARAPALGVKRLRSLLQDSLAILATNRRDAPARQQTMRSTLEWSYQLLDPREQAALRKASVFSGGFSLAAFCDLAGSTGVDDWQTVELLEALVAKSMVSVDGEDPPRYSLLETTRVYALEKLKECDEADATNRKHALYFTSYFESVYALRFRVTEREMAARTWPEMGNLRAALAHTLLQKNDLVQGVTLMAVSLPAWLEGRRQQSYEGRRYFDVASRVAVGLELESRTRGRLSLGVGIVYAHVDIERSSHAFEEAIEAFRFCGDHEAEAHALIHQARVLARKSALDAARTMLDQAAALLAQANNPWLSAFHENCLGSISGGTLGIDSLALGC